MSPFGVILDVLKEEIQVKKNTGELQPFDVEKLINSLKRSGASDEIVQTTVDEIISQLYPGIPTRKIYKTAFNILRKKSLLVSSHYKLKEAILELGPTGYPFEILIARLFERAGYKVSNGVLMDGVCIQHEVDVLAKNGKSIEIVECKFHNRNDLKNDVKVPLYINSRYIDIVQYNSNRDENFKCWLATNTRFTEDAIKYSKCAGISLIGWDYPERNNLKERIGASGLYPITTLNKLTKKEKSLLIDKGIIFCEDILKQKDRVEDILHYKSTNAIIKEARNLSRA